MKILKILNLHFKIFWRLAANIREKYIEATSLTNIFQYPHGCTKNVANISWNKDFFRIKIILTILNLHFEHFWRLVADTREKCNDRDLSQQFLPIFSNIPTGARTIWKKTRRTTFFLILKILQILKLHFVIFWRLIVDIQGKWNYKNLSQQVVLTICSISIVALKIWAKVRETNTFAELRKY